MKEKNEHTQETIKALTTNEQKKTNERKKKEPKKQNE